MTRFLGGDDHASMRQLHFHIHNTTASLWILLEEDSVDFDKKGSEMCQHCTLIKLNPHSGVPKAKHLFLFVFLLLLCFFESSSHYIFQVSLNS
jgi:hypothetical protein